MIEQQDRCIRAMLDDGSFRAITVRATDLVKSVVAAQGATGDTARLLAELVTGGVLVRETMAPNYRVQLILRDSLGGQLVADCMPEGKTRGLMRVADTRLGVLLGDDSILQVVRMMYGGQSQEGVVSAGHEGGVSAALMNYMQQSEQITTMIAVECVMDEDEVLAAGGYVVQILPTITEAPLAIMTERLADFDCLGERLRDWDADPEKLMGELLYGFDYTRLDETEVNFHCSCDAVRVLSALATLPTEDIQDLMDAEEVVSMDCDYCGSSYEMGPEMLRSLLDKN